MNTIFIDFDDTIYNTKHRLEEIAGKKITGFDISKVGLDLSVFSRKDFYKLNTKYLKQNFLFNFLLIQRNFHIEILTKYINEVEQMYKQQFLTYLGLDDIKINFVQYNDNKQKYLSNNDILIDDQIDNLVDNKYNILYDPNNNNKHYHGVRLTNWNDIYYYIKNNFLIFKKR